MREAAATPAAAIPVATPLATPVVAAETPLPITPTAVATSQVADRHRALRGRWIGAALGKPARSGTSGTSTAGGASKATRIPSFSSNGSIHGHLKMLKFGGHASATPEIKILAIKSLVVNAHSLITTSGRSAVGRQKSRPGAAGAPGPIWHLETRAGSVDLADLLEARTFDDHLDDHAGHVAGLVELLRPRSAFVVDVLAFT